MIDPRIRALAERYQLPQEAVEQLESLHCLLVRDPLAPTAVRDPAKVVDDHLADSLVALELDQVQSAATLADLGSGAGVPGIPLAIALPQTRVALVESVARKAAFLARAVAQCGVPNAYPVHARAESWPEGLEVFEVVTARALAPLEVVVEYAAPLLKVGGTLVAWRGLRDRTAEDAGARAATRVGLEPGAVVPVRPYSGAQSRHLHLMSKVMATPSGFPRRPGVARKRPLSAK